MSKTCISKKIKKILPVLCGISLVLMICGCSKEEAVTSRGMVRVGTLNVEADPGYTDESPAEEVTDSFVSDDGLCRIEIHPSYYDVTLDYEHGTPAQVGKAYALTILEAIPDYAQVFEPYLYENIRGLFAGREINYESLEKRITSLVSSIPDEYRIEVEAFAGAISGGEEGYEEDGKLSYIEALTMQIIPDGLRPTACSALTVDGSLTESGERITMRNLEWSVGSSGQISLIHAVVHMRKGEGSITCISMVGILDVITAINDNGVMIGILDVGTVDRMPFVYESKKCYTFEIRYALEHFSTAREAAEFLISESGDFTWCDNLLVTDKNDAFCCENATREVANAGKGVSVLRTPDTELMEGLVWDTPGAMCIVNSFATKDNQDGFSGNPGNFNRFVKYNKWVSENGIFSVADMKGIMAHETVDSFEVENVHNSGTVHTVILDYDTGDIHVAFTSGRCADDIPKYILVGNYGD